MADVPIIEPLTSLEREFAATISRSRAAIYAQLLDLTMIALQARGSLTPRCDDPSVGVGTARL
jgi:hypothetical protein